MGHLLSCCPRWRTRHDVFTCVCIALVHTCEIQTQAQMKVKENEKKNFRFLRRRIRLRLHLRYGSSHIYFLHYVCIFQLRRMCEPGLP